MNMLGISSLLRRAATTNPALMGIGGGAIGGALGGLTSGDRGGTLGGTILGAGAGIGLKYGSRPLRRMMRGQGIWGGGKPWGSTLKSNQAVNPQPSFLKVTDTSKPLSPNELSMNVGPWERMMEDQLYNEIGHNAYMARIAGF